MWSQPWQPKTGLIALLVRALVEPRVRRATAHRGLAELPRYPEEGACPASSAARIVEAFGGLAGQHLPDAHGHLVRTFSAELTSRQRQPLDLLEVPAASYR